ncbi:MAG: SAM-dependent methyltransferase [Opitutales bacterium]|nr:SAM-dependent methyltransferase [Opitutales bacterium]
MNAIGFEDFSRQALFDPQHGYYTRGNATRVGIAAGTDFYTATSVASVFAPLLCEAAKKLLRGNAAGSATPDWSRFTFVEIGSESSESPIVREAKRHFGAVKTIRVGEPIVIPPEAIVFANELFDAQPFARLLVCDGAWREIGVTRGNDGGLCEVLLEKFSNARLADFAGTLDVPDDGWHLDISLEAENLMATICGGDWHGVAIFPDYGKTVADCLTGFPAGTARAYYRHTQSNDLLARPGEQDLTCHVMWERLEAVARSRGAREVVTRRQEAFFMNLVPEKIMEISARGNEWRAKLMELIHPAKMGHAFQVLSFVR